MVVHWQFYLISGPESNYQPELVNLQSTDFRGKRCKLTWLRQHPAFSKSFQSSKFTLANSQI